MADEPRPGQTAPPGAGGGADPTMEDILASIRRILNEDEPGAAPAPPPMPPEGEPLALTEAMLVADPAKAAGAAPPPALATPAAAPAAAPEPPAPPQPAPGPATVQPAPLPEVPPAPASDEVLLGPAASAAASAALGQLVRAVAQDRGAPVLRSGGPSIEDVVRDEVRPLLKDWLDQHLPPLVERLVRAEIERVVGRALH